MAAFVYITRASFDTGISNFIIQINFRMIELAILAHVVVLIDSIL